MILDWFRQQILSGQMKEGDTIPSERELAAQFGVSRVPVREALRILEYIGIISNGADGMIIQRVDVQLFTPGANFATEITQETIENLFEVRIFLESAAAYYAALRHTDEDIEQIRNAITAMSAAIDDPDADSEAFTRSSHAFHLRVIAAAKNPVLETCTAVSMIFWRFPNNTPCVRRVSAILPSWIMKPFSTKSRAEMRMMPANI